MKRKTTAYFTLAATIFLLFVSSEARGQDSSYYQQAAALYDQAAAKCSGPGASCMRQYAAYNRCLAAQYSGGGSCGAPPTCSTACSNSSSNGGTTSTMGGTTGNNTANQVGQLAQEVGNLLSQWAAAREAKHEQQARDLQRKLDQEIAQMEAESQAEDQRARERAAFLADSSGASLPQAPGDLEDQTARLRAQLYAEQQADASSTPASGDLSNGDATLQAATTGTLPNAGAAIDSLPNDQPSAAPTTADPTTNPAFASVIPQNPNFAAAMQNSQDSPPSPTVLNAVQQEADVANPVTDSIHDGLQGLISTAGSDVASVKATLGTLMDTPTAQIMTGGLLTTVPAPVATDTPEQMADKVHAQAIVGFGYFTKSAFPKALYEYMSSNMNQFMTQLGFAAPLPDSGSQQ
jgi:hypothetical protein